MVWNYCKLLLYLSFYLSDVNLHEILKSTLLNLAKKLSV